MITAITSPPPDLVISSKQQLLDSAQYLLNSQNDVAEKVW
ncbi:hypothetical protein SPLC1_S131690 [Arthrospira platensis C1]|nr:hypothetical protein SPLC1_S131690 [Arthrospira platensis C1]